MATLKNSAEGGTPATTVTHDNSGGSSGNAFDSTSSTGATDIFDNTDPPGGAHGTLAFKVATTTSATAYNAYSTSMSWNSKMWFRMYLYFTANPGANTSIFGFWAATAQRFFIQIYTNGQINLRNASSTSILSTNASIPLNQWFRIEGWVIFSATVGQVEIKLFNSMDATEADETQTSLANQNTGSTIADNARYGLAKPGTNLGPYWFDDVGLDNAGYIGPETSVTDVPLTEAGASAEALALSSTVPLTESGAGADALAVTANIALTESGAGGDALAVTAGVPLTEAGTSSESLALESTVPLAESGAGADLLVVPSLFESGAGADALGITADIALTEGGAGADSLDISTVAAIGLAEAGAGDGSLSVTADIALTEAGASAEALTLEPVAIGFAEAGAGSDSLTITADIALTESGASAEAFDPGIAVGLSIDTLSLPDATVGSAYSELLSVSGGTAPYVWTIAAGSLPEWAELS